MAPTGVSSGIIISAVAVAGRRGNNRLGGEGSAPTGHSSCSADLHGQRWRSRHESPERRRGRSGGCELESKCSRLSDAAHSVTGMSHPAARRFITRDTSDVQRKQVGQGMQESICQNRTHEYRYSSLLLTIQEPTARSWIYEDKHTHILFSFILFCTINHWHAHKKAACSHNLAS